MGITYNNSSFVSTNLVLMLDAQNIKSYNGNKSIINWSNWTTGSGGVTGYDQNGLTAENERVNATDPWGYTNVVWETRPSGDGNADGGWNTSYFNIDRTKLYRFSVWARRTSSTTGGTFYLGMYDDKGSVRMDNSSIETNAYWDCRNIAWMTQNQWYLVVGHVYPYDTTFTGRHPDTGIYTTSSGRISEIGGCNIGSGDIKWNSTATSGLHRTYHFYCTDSTSRLQFYQPRVDLVDGREPKITDLLNNVEGTWFDLSGKRNHCKFASSIIPTWNSAGYFTFNGSSHYGTIAYNSSLNFSGGQSILIVMNHNISSLRPNPWNQAYGGSGTWTHEAGADMNYYYGNTGTNATPYTNLNSGSTPTNTWYGMCSTRDSSNIYWYQNATQKSTAANAYGNLAQDTNNIQIGLGDTGNYWGGNIALIAAYDRALTQAEITQNFNAYRRRFGL